MGNRPSEAVSAVIFLQAINSRGVSPISSGVCGVEASHGDRNVAGSGSDLGVRLHLRLLPTLARVSRDRVGQYLEKGRGLNEEQGIKGRSC